MLYGKSIELFLVDGKSDGLITAELSNWNGKAIKIPRTEVKTCCRADVKGVGVYFLFCQEEDGDDAVYIGEAENVLDRLIQHTRDYNSGKEKYYWNTTVLFVGQDLNKALIRYLENRFVLLARECNRYKILTKNTYKNTVMKESQVATMEEFIDNAKIIMGTLGYKVLAQGPKPIDSTVYLHCNKAGSNAKGFISNGGFTILKDSKISEKMVPSLEVRGKTYFNLRQKLESDGTIVDKIFTRDYEFSAPSAASAVVLGRNSNGNIDWKTQAGVSLRDI